SVPGGVGAACATPSGDRAIATASQPAPAADGTFALFERASDIWIAAREGLEQFAAIGVASELSTAAVDRDPYVQPTGAEVYFASDRTGGNGDLYHTLRVGNAFVVPTRIAELVTAF